MLRPQTDRPTAMSDEQAIAVASHVIFGIPADNDGHVIDMTARGLRRTHSAAICSLNVLMGAVMSLNYVMIGSNDVAKARAYYDAILSLIGGKVFADFMPHGFCYELRNGGRIWVAPPHNREAATPGNGNMVGLLCESEAEVCAAHTAALANGGSNEGNPGPRPQYGPNFYGAYVRDLDGNKMSFVYFGGDS